TALLGAGGMVDLNSSSPAIGIGLSLTSTLLLAALFSTARKRNGYAAMHDFATGTRVVRHLRQSARGVPDMAPDPLPATSSHLRRYGPFEVIGTLGSTGAGELLVAVDPR